MSHLFHLVENILIGALVLASAALLAIVIYFPGVEAPMVVILAILWGLVILFLPFFPSLL